MKNAAFALAGLSAKKGRAFFLTVLPSVRQRKKDDHSGIEGQSQEREVHRHFEERRMKKTVFSKIHSGLVHLNVSRTGPWVHHYKHMSDDTFVSRLAMEGNRIAGTSGMSFVEKPPYFACPSGKLGLRYVCKSRVQAICEARSYGCGSVHITASDLGGRLYTAYGFKHNGNCMMHDL